MVKASIEWEHSKENGLVLRIKPPFGLVSPGSVCRHARTASKEMLLAVRGLIDMTVNRIEAKEKECGQHGTKIEVQ